MIAGSSAQNSSSITNAAQALDFFAAWGRSFDQLCDSFHANFADDCLWDQRPIPRLRGPDQAVRFLKLSRVALRLDTIDVEIVQIAEQDGTVLCTRIDRLRRADGSLIAAAPVAGALEFRDGRITRWREYFDAGGLAGKALASSVAHLGRRARLIGGRCVSTASPG